MSRFAPALRRLAGELDVPRAVRAAILLEMAADLEAAFEHHLRSGRSEEEAARRAEAEVLGSTEVIRRLGRLHDTGWRGWSEEVGARLSGGLDLLLVAVAVAPMLLLAAAVSAVSLAEEPTPAGWLLAAVAAGMLAVSVREASLLLAGRYGASRRLSLLLVLSAVAPAVGALAVGLGVYGAAMELSGSPSGGEAAALLLARVLVRDGSALLAGLLLGLAGLLSWFILLNRRTQRAAQEVDRLLRGAVPPGPAPGEPRVVPLTRIRRRG